MGNVGLTNKPTSASNLTVDDFEFLFLVGKGAFGKVWKVQKKDTGKIYAMKMLKKREVLEQNLVEHTNLERDIMAVFGSHPFIINLYFAFQTADKLHFVLDYLPGGSLFYHLSNHEGPFPESVVVFYTAEIMVGLETLHKNNIVYRDLKLENILLDSEGHIKLTDFGLSAKLEQNRLIHSFSGTALYLAPEILMDRGEGHGKSVDWWSLGVLIHVMLTQEPPFWSENNRALFDMIMRQDVSFDSKYLSREATSLLRGLLTKDWRKRLGCGAQGPDEIKAHPFFGQMDWGKLIKKKITPPIRPADQDVQEIDFDSAGTVIGDESMPSVNAVRRDPILKKHKAAFADFSFVSDRPPPNMQKVNLNLPQDSSIAPDPSRMTDGSKVSPTNNRIDSPTPNRKPSWIPDKEVSDCNLCHFPFTTLRRRHHCRQCGKIYCNACSSKRVKIPEFGYFSPVRICDICFQMRHPDLPLISSEERARLLAQESGAERSTSPPRKPPQVETNTLPSVATTPSPSSDPIPTGIEKKDTGRPIPQPTALSESFDLDSDSPDTRPLPSYRSPLLDTNFLSDEAYKQNRPKTSLLPAEPVADAVVSSNTSLNGETQATNEPKVDSVDSLGLDDDDKRTRSLIIGQRQRPMTPPANLFADEDEGRVLALAAVAAQAQALLSMGNIPNNLVVSSVPAEENNDS